MTKIPPRQELMSKTSMKQSQIKVVVNLMVESTMAQINKMVIQTVLQPVLRNSKFHRNLEQPFPTAATTPIVVSKSSSSMMFLTQVLQFPLIKKHPQLLRRTTSIVIRNTLDLTAYLIECAQCIFLIDVYIYFFFSLAVFLIELMSIAYCYYYSYNLRRRLCSCFCFLLLQRQIGVIIITPNKPITKQSNDNHCNKIGVLQAIYSRAQLPIQYPFYGCSQFGLRNSKEKVPKITDPDPVPIKMSPLTYILLPTRYLLHWEMALVKLNPAASPNPTPQKTINRQTLGTSEDTQTMTALIICPKVITRRGCVFLARQIPVFMVKPIDIIIKGNAIAVNQSVMDSSERRQQLVMQILIMPH